MSSSPYFWFILIAILAFFALDRVSSLLNLKALSPTLPPEFSDVYDADKYAKSQEYTRVSAKFGILVATISLIVTLIFWLSGGFGWLDGIVRGFGRGPIITGLIYIGILMAALHLIQVPFNLYDTFVIEEKFGFNKMTLGTWFSDQLKGVALGLIIGLPLLALILFLFEKVPHAWLWAWLAMTAFSLILTYVAPTWIMPLFNKFEPLPEGELKTEIHKMAEQCDFPLKEVSIMDGSKRSAKSNAFFTGIGNNKRIALFDTLVENHSVSELVAVLAHEIGHFKKKHIVQSMVISIIGSGVMFFLLGFFMKNQGLHAAFGVEKTSVYLSLIFFGMLFQPISSVVGIAGNMFSRHNEFEADAYAAEVTGDKASMAAALKKLSADNLSNLTPHPFHVFLNYTHPPVIERIRALEGK